MDNDRVLENRNLILENLNLSVGKDHRLRLIWLVEHLEDYLSRWVGFVELPSKQVSNVLATDLHVILIAGVDIFDEELSNAPVVHGMELLKDKWLVFATLVRTVGPNHGKDICERLESALTAVTAICKKDINA